MSTCLSCGASFQQGGMGRPRRYCAPTCRPSSQLEVQRGYARRSAAKHPEVAKAYRAAHREELRAAARRRRAADSEQHRAYERAYDEGHPGRRAAIGAAYRKRWPERARAAVRKYRTAHRTEHATRQIRRRALRAGSGGSHTTREWLDKIELFGGCCIYCGEARPLERDHRIPLARGGADAITNVVPACKPCNSSKRNRTDVEFIAWRREHQLGGQVIRPGDVVAADEREAVTA